MLDVFDLVFFPGGVVLRVARPRGVVLHVARPCSVCDDGVVLPADTSNDGVFTSNDGIPLAGVSDGVMLHVDTSNDGHAAAAAFSCSCHHCRCWFNGNLYELIESSLITQSRPNLL